MGDCPCERRLTTDNIFFLDRHQPNTLAKPDRGISALFDGVNCQCISPLFLFETETLCSLTLLHAHGVVIDYIYHADIVLARLGTTLALSPIATAREFFFLIVIR